MKIAVNMITLNAEQEIRRALDSIRGLYDYLVVCDTGSTDKTKEILKDYGATVVHYKNPPDWKHPFTDNLADARNMALTFTPNRADWVVVIDSDEEMIGSKILREKLLNFEETAGKISIAYDHHTAPADIPYRVRVFSRADFTWFRAVHQILFGDLKLPTFDWTNEGITIKHHQKDIHSHHQRYEVHLTKAITDSKTQVDHYDAVCRLVEHIARYGGETKKALMLVDNFMYAGSLIWGAKIHRRIGNYLDALSLAKTVEELLPTHEYMNKNDAYLELATIYLKMNQKELANQYLEKMAQPM